MILRAIDICGGAGGWAVAARGLPIKIVAAVDHAEDCLATYARNHPGVETVFGDASTLDYTRWHGKIDVVLGGIPCEQVSAARRGVAIAPAKMQAWQRLVDRCLSLPGELGAAWWCYEDVTDILRFIPEKTPHFVVDSQHWSPQRRKRAFVGNVPPPLKLTLDPRMFAHAQRPGPYRTNPRLLGRLPGTGLCFGGKQKARAGMEKRFHAWDPAKKSPTVVGLTSQHDHDAAAPLPDGTGWRQLEWQELAVLQGFPPDYVFLGSAGRVTKMVAQAVQIETARAILGELVHAASPKKRRAA